MPYATDPAYLEGRDLAETFGITVTRAVHTSKVTIFLGSDGVLYLRYAPGAKVDVEDFREYDAQLLVHTQSANDRAILLVDPKNIDVLTKSARTAIASAEISARFYAVAILARSSLEQALGGFFIYLDRPEVPTRLFTSVAKAREWLRSMRDNARMTLPPPNALPDSPRRDQVGTRGHEYGAGDRANGQ